MIRKDTARATIPSTEGLLQTCSLYLKWSEPTLYAFLPFPPAERDQVFAYLPRCIFWQIPNAQCLGTQRFRYGIVPYEGDPWTAGLPHLAASFDSPLLARPISRGEGHLPPAFSFVTLDGEYRMLSALKRNEAGYRAVVWFYNAGESSFTPTVRFGLPVDRVQRASAEEIELAELKAIGAH